MCRARSSGRRLAAGCLLALLLCCGSARLLHAEEPVGETPAGTWLPLPRFASLKSDRVQLHQGPGAEFPVAWVFRRAGLPVEVMRESAAWCEVRDSEGTTGWVWSTALSRRRTALILPRDATAGQSRQAAVPLRDDDSENAQTLANVEAGVLAAIIACDGRWCRVSIGNFRGYVEQGKLWGTREGEVIR